MEPIESTVNPSGSNGVNQPNGNGTPAENQGGSRKFSQEEVNEIIKNRLGRYSDYEDLVKYKESAESNKLTELERLQKTIDKLSPYKDQATKQQQVLEELLTQELESVPEAYRGLIPDTFGTLDKLTYIKKNRGVFGNPSQTPSVPANPNLQPSNIGLFGGKYSSLAEYASKDPKGYADYRKNNKLT